MKCATVSLLFGKEKRGFLGVRASQPTKRPVCRVNGEREESGAGSGAARTGSPSAGGDACAEHGAVLGY